MGTLVPHPPIMVEGVGKTDDLEQIANTRRAMKEIGRLLEEASPDTLVVFTPHGAVYQDAIIIYGDEKLSGNLAQFGVNTSWSWQNDLELAGKITELGRDSGLPVYLMELAMASGRRRFPGLDHGVLAPLSFFLSPQLKKAKLVVIPLSFLPFEELYQFGTVVRDASRVLAKRVAVIASGDLSHCLLPGAPAGYNPKGAEFDAKIVELLRQNAVEPFFEIDPVLREKAAECGYRSIIMLLGTLDEMDYETKVHSYEGPFGVGYAVASFHNKGKRESRLTKLFAARKEKIDKRRGQESPLVRYARMVVEAEVRGQRLPEPVGVDKFFKDQAGVFVSIKKYGQLRGCIGTIEPTQANVVFEVRQNAISAATRDPRFEPVTKTELEDLVYSVDVLKPAEPISGVEDLNPERYGVIVSSGYKKGLLLPNLEGVATAEEQVTIAKRKAGIGPGEPVTLERFEVVRYY